MEKEKIQKLKETQDKLEYMNKILKDKSDAFEKENKELLSSMATLQENISDIKFDLTKEASAEFIETGEKKLLGGIGIRIMNRLSYNPEAAIIWAHNNMPVAIKKTIDKKQFEVYAKANDLDFVERQESITVTFPKEIII